MTDPGAFYDELAESYDALTATAEKAQRAQRFCDDLLQRTGADRVLDAACGTGLYALAFARAGATVTGADISPGQISLARDRARKQGLDVQWAVAAFHNLPAVTPGPWDLVTCLGNSIVHLLTEAQLQAAANAFAAVLSDSGHLVLSLLNYAPILRDQQRVVGITRRGDREFIRFYDFLAERQLRFNVLSITGSEDPEHRLTSTRLCAWSRDEIAAVLQRAGFDEIEASGGYRFEPYDPETSDVLVLHARRQA
jgi:2-polyprenyl-3-methyl-5-hydroxy-6-metoxy-1,4-benzoquinol methylase